MPKREWRWTCVRSGFWLGSSPGYTRCELQRFKGIWRWRKSDAPPYERNWHDALSFDSAKRDMREQVR